MQNPTWPKTRFFSYLCNMFVDTHTHFYDEWLLPDAEEAVRRAIEAGVGKMIQADVDSRERPAMWEIGKRHPGVLFQMLGLYPGSVGKDWKEELDQVYALAKGTTNAPARSEATQGVRGIRPPVGETSPKTNAPARSEATQGVRGIRPPVGETSPKTNAPAFVAIGEIGLDYHEGLAFAKEQKEVLRLQLELASALNIPVNIHLRDAWEDFFAILSDCAHLHLRGNLHCFTSSYEIYERANRRADFSVGIGGVVTFKNASVAKAVERIPLGKILLETDAPYLAPVPYRGKRNESAYLPLIGRKVADIKGLPLQEIETMTTHNAESLFGI